MKNDIDNFTKILSKISEFSCICDIYILKNLNMTIVFTQKENELES